MSLWQALFPQSTPVDPYEYKSPTSSPLYSYPAGFVRHFFQSTYAALANTAPVGNWPGFQLLTSEDSFGALPLDSRELYDRIETVKAMFPKGGGPIPPGKGPDPASDLTQAYLFLQPLTTPAKGQTYGTTPPPAVPQFDFHQAVSLLGRHPALLRLFGLVYELELVRPSGLSGTVAVSVVPSWKPKLGGPPLTINVKPVTMTDAGEWIPAHRTSDPEIASGFLRFSDPDYAVVEMDLDGATLKAFNFVQGIQHATTEMRAADTPTHYAVPSLRSAGLAVAKTGNALSLHQNWQNNNGFNAAVEASPPGAVTLYFEDIAQGYRVDVWSKGEGSMVSALCPDRGEEPGAWRLRDRVAADGRAGPEWRRGLGRARDDPERHLLRVAEPAGVRAGVLDALVRVEPCRRPSWQAPVRHSLRRARARRANPASSNLQLQIDYAAAPGTLPTLRFGGTYRFRARAVDIAGNSVPFTKTGGFTWATPEVTYRRFEPVPSPVLVPTAPRTPGEHVEHLVIRSNYDVPDDDPSIVAVRASHCPRRPRARTWQRPTVSSTAPTATPIRSSYSLIARSGRPHLQVAFQFATSTAA